MITAKWRLPRGGLLFLNGLGAIAGPLVTGWVMDQIGPGGFFVFIATLMGTLALYAAYRMTQRAAPTGDTVGGFATLTPSASVLAVEAVLEQKQPGGGTRDD